MKKIYLIGIALMVLLLFAWSPWITNMLLKLRRGLERCWKNSHFTCVLCHVLFLNMIQI